MPSRIVRSVLPLVWKGDAVVGLDAAFRNAIADMTADPLTHHVDDDGLYAGPVALFDYYAEEHGNLAWTIDLLETLGERFARRVLGHRIDPLTGERASWAYLLNQNAGRGRALELVAELMGGVVSWTVGIFNKDATSPDDKSLWQITVPANVRHTGIDVLIGRDSGILSIPEAEWLSVVIPRLIPYTLVDVRVSVFATTRYNAYYGMHMWQEALYEGP